MKRFQPPSNVTVVVQVGPFAQYLPQCLDSLLEQSHAPHQIVVTDLNDDQLQPSAKPFMRYVTPMEHFRSPAWKRTWVRTDYLLPLSAQDWLSPTALEALELVLDMREHTGLVHARAWIGNSGHWQKGFESSCVMPPALLIRCAALSSSALTPEVLAQVHTGGALSLLQPGWSIYHIPHPLGYHRLIPHHNPTLVARTPGSVASWWRSAYGP